MISINLVAYRVKKQKLLSGKCYTPTYKYKWNWRHHRILNLLRRLYTKVKPFIIIIIVLVVCYYDIYVLMTWLTDTENEMDPTISTSSTQSTSELILVSPDSKMKNKSEVRVTSLKELKPIVPYYRRREGTKIKKIAKTNKSDLVATFLASANASHMLQKDYKIRKIKKHET